MAETGFWIAEGWISQGQLYVDGVKITSLPIQSDMNRGRQWIRPGNAADLVAPAKLVDTPTGQRFAYGGLNFAWPMQGLSPKMVQYLQTNYFSPGTTPSNFMNRGWSNKLTVQTWNRASGEWEVYHCYGKFADFNSEAELALGGYHNLQLKFNAYKVAEVGPNLNLTLTVPSTIYEDDEFTLSFVINNTGDSDTFSTITVDYTIPNNMDFVSYNDGVADTTLSYSVDGTTFSTTPPGDLTTVVKIRIVYNAVITTGTSTSSISINLMPTTLSSGNSSVMTVTTLGDSNNADNTDTRTLNIVAWTPAALSGLYAWYKSNAESYTTGTTQATNGQTIQTWGDQSGNNRDATQSSAGNRPTFVTGGASGFPYIDFSAASSNYMNIVDTDKTVTPLSAIFILDATDSGAAADNQILMTLRLSGNNSLSFAHIDNDTGFKDSVGILQTSTWTRFFTSVSGLQSYTYRSRSDNSTRFYQNGVVQGSDTAVTTYTLLDNSIIGADLAATGGFFNGKLYEIVVLTTNMSDTDFTNLTTYISSRYGI